MNKEEIIKRYNLDGNDWFDNVLADCIEGGYVSVENGATNKEDMKLKLDIKKMEYYLESKRQKPN